MIYVSAPNRPDARFSVKKSVFEMKLEDFEKRRWKSVQYRFYLQSLKDEWDEMFIRHLPLKYIQSRYDDITTYYVITPFELENGFSYLERTIDSDKIDRYEDVSKIGIDNIPENTQLMSEKQHWMKRLHKSYIYLEIYNEILDRLVSRDFEKMFGLKTIKKYKTHINIKINGRDYWYFIRKRFDNHAVFERFSVPEDTFSIERISI